MNSSRLARSFLSIWLAAGLIAGCSAPLTPAGETTMVSPAPAQISATLSPTPARPTHTLVAATATPQITPTPKITSVPVSRPPSGWAIFSNPDFVQGIAVRENHLWAATLGGVIDWNTNSKTPVVYTTRDGLVEIQANDVVICAMPQERVLVSHEIGVLSAYDLELKKWGRIPITFEDGSTLTGVSALFCDLKNDRLLAGSTDGLGIMDMKTGRWKHIGAKEGLQVDTIKAIDVVGQSIWIAAGKQSAFMIQGSTIFPFNGASGFPSGSVNDLSVGPDFSIWLGYPTGLLRYKDKRWNSYGSQVRSGIPFVSVDEVEVGSDNSIWIASAEEGICPFDLSTLFCSTIYPSPRNAPINDLAIGEDGRAYAATQGNGILVLEKDNRENLLLNRQKLMSNDVRDITESADGKLWLATNQGVNYFALNRSLDAWQTIFPERNGLIQPQVAGVLSVGNGLWLYYDQEPEVSYLNGSDWIHLNERDGISGPVNDAEVDQRGYIWFATSQGIDIWDGVAMRSYGPDTGLDGNVYHTLLEDDGVMWIGTDEGLLKYDQFQWKIVLPELSVNAIAAYGKNELLLGTDQGLILFNGSQSYQWLIRSGDNLFMNIPISSLSVDQRGNLWVGTYSQGLFYYNGVAWEQFDTSRGMPTNRIQKIFTDSLGAVWIAATTGKGGGALVRFMP